ncbi:MAG: hypothetical protein KDD69_12225 [Bdellovibrionales bacterium]|nr:hypothetical protein [Bdellovibrionales bacterium]
MSAEKVTAFRICIGPGFRLDRVKEVLKEWQQKSQSHCRLYCSETTGLLCGEEEHWVVVEGYTVDSRNIFAAFGVVVGIHDMYNHLHQALNFDRDVVRVIIFPADLQPSSAP